MELLEKLNKVQVEMKAPKGQFNKFGNYSYRSAEDIQEAFKPYAEEYKLVLTLEDFIHEVGNRIYIGCTARLRDVESDKATSVNAFARECLTKKGMDEAQITGAASSYARKYALCGLFLLDDTKDPDTYEKPTQANTGNAAAIIEDIKMLKEQCIAKGIPAEELSEWIRCNFTTTNLAVLDIQSLVGIKNHLREVSS